MARLLVGWLVMLVLGVLGWSTRVGNVPGVERVAHADVMVLGSAGEQPPVPGPAQRVDLPHVLQEPRRNSSGRASYSLAWPVDHRVSGSDKAQGILLSRVGPRFRVLVKGFDVGSEGWYLGPGYFDSGPQAPWCACRPTSSRLLAKATAFRSIFRARCCGLPGWP